MHRYWSSLLGSYVRPTFGRRLTLATISSGTIFLGWTKLRSDSPDGSFFASSNPPLSSLVRAYTVYSMCSIPPLVDSSPQILHTLSSVPVLRQITEAFVRVTFFNQFVGGDSAPATVPLLRRLRLGNKGALLVYSAEVDDGHTIPSTSNSSNRLSYKRFVDEIIRSIDAAAEVEDSVESPGATSRHAWVAFKLTALAPSQALFNYSKHIVHIRQSKGIRTIPFPGCPTTSDLAILYGPQQSEFMREEDISSIRALHAELERICAHANIRGVKVAIDAEYSWFQPAIDALQLSLMRKYNKLDGGNHHHQPLIYGTWQAYLRRNPRYLEEALQDAREHNYSLGIKLVRGAYHPREISTHAAASSKTVDGGCPDASLSISPEEIPPVWMFKAETDECYNDGIRTLVKAIAEDVRTGGGEDDDREREWWSLSRVWANATKPAHRAPRISVLFATHNWDSCNLVLEELTKANLAGKGELSDFQGNNRITISVPDETLRRVAIAQLYGMCDDLTDSLVARTKSEAPLVMKYVPYGSLSEVLPYLSRRAIENKSVLGDGAASRERKRAWTLLRTRLIGSN